MNHFDGTAPVLDHVGLRSEDPENLASFYRDAMGFEFSVEHEVYIGLAPGRRIAIERGKSKTLSYGGYAFSSSEDLYCYREVLEERGVAISASPSAFFNDKAFCVTDPDGHRIVFGFRVEDDGTTRQSLPSARVQHLVVASDNVTAMIRFYTEALGFGVSDEVLSEDGDVTACFLHSDHEHHSFAVFRAPEKRLDHHSYEVGDWNAIRDWCDHFASQEHLLHWGPGRHGAGNNLFAMVHDADGNWIEVSAELETISEDRSIKRWEHGPRPLNLWGQAKLRS